MDEPDKLLQPTRETRGPEQWLWEACVVSWARRLAISSAGLERLVTNQRNRRG
jgi:hypothetical protein